MSSADERWLVRMSLESRRAVLLSMKESCTLGKPVDHGCRFHSSEHQVEIPRVIISGEFLHG